MRIKQNCHLKLSFSCDFSRFFFKFPMILVDFATRIQIREVKMKRIQSDSDPKQCNQPLIIWIDHPTNQPTNHYSVELIQNHVPGNQWRAAVRSGPCPRPRGWPWPCPRGREPPAPGRGQGYLQPWNYIHGKNRSDACSQDFNRCFDSAKSSHDATKSSLTLPKAHIKLPKSSHDFIPRKSDFRGFSITAEIVYTHTQRWLSGEPLGYTLTLIFHKHSYSLYALRRIQSLTIRI